MSKEEITNCLTCGTGRNWWFDGPKCPICEGNPLKKGGGRSDHADWHRARMIDMFGSRRQGDEEILVRYEQELKGLRRNTDKDLNLLKRAMKKRAIKNYEENSPEKSQ